MKKVLFKHVTKNLVGVTFLTSAMIYPFMPGDYDRMAMPLSICVQIISISGLLLSVVAVAWILMPGKFRMFAVWALYLASFLALVTAFIAYLLAGIVFGLIMLGSWALIIVVFRQRLRRSTGKASLLTVPYYLIVIPLSVLAIQLLIARPLTDWSRHRTIGIAQGFIRDIEQYKLKNGFYPKTLQAMYHDYSPNTVGVEQFHYLPSGNAYNVSFEQPRFFLDVLGTREWVVYNPYDQHRVYSHTSWLLLLLPEESDLRQGWYASSGTGHKYWKSFFFD